MFRSFQTIYRGTRNGRTHANVVMVGVGKSLDRMLHPGPSQSVKAISPNGFEWGYPGSGPAQLALAILLDFSNDAGLALQQHDAFKWAYVVDWTESSWQITGAEVFAWLQSNGAAISNDAIPPVHGR